MRAAAILVSLALAGCAASQSTGVEEGTDVPFSPTYKGIETRLLDGDLVDFQVSMTGARSEEDVVNYARCAAAQYALIRGYGFARHVRTTTAKQGATWTADSVYTISPALPRGLRTIDAEVTVADCGAQGIPTV